MQGFVGLMLMIGGVAMADGLKQGKEMVDAARTMIANGITVIDVRQEACQGYVKGATLISVDDIANKDSAALKKISDLTKNNKATQIAVYCQAGVRAEKAMKELKSLGYTNVQNLGGIQDYRNDIFMEKCSH